VRILLDECVPARLAGEIPGHDVTTVRRMQWAGFNDGTLLRRASAEFDVFLTVDQSLGFQQVLPPGLALLTLVSRSIEIHALRPLIPAILLELKNIKPGEMSRIGA
jgi:hypothetical protein